MIFSQTPVYLVQKLFSQSQCYLSDKNSIALTFDDGPINEATPIVLEILKHYNIKATFFCIGQNIKKNPALYESIQAQGHCVANHTFSHVNGWKTRTTEYLQDIKKCQELMPHNKLFRPPYGKMTKKQYRQIIDFGLKPIFWSVISYDYHSAMNAERCLKMLKKKTIGGQIILFHDSIKSISLITCLLPQYIEFCQKLNIKFVPLNQSI